MEDVMNGQGKLALCECGELHFTYGAITVHFEREEFFLFAEAVGRLSAMIKQTAHSLPSRPTSNVKVCH
jgi:hypothetical protein